MRAIAISILILLLSGCVGLAVGTYGTFEDVEFQVNIAKERNKFNYGKNTEKLTKEKLISTWGEPDATSKIGKCDVVTYYDGYNWSGIGAFIVVVPIPLLVPSGHEEKRFYFINGESVGLVSEYGEVSSAFGYMCGSNECKWVAGSVNEEKQGNVKVDWCE